MNLQFGLTKSALLSLAASVAWCLPLCGDDTAYRVALAAASRAAAGRVLPSVVTIEIIGAGDVGNGEVEQDAPTSGVIVDGSGFIIGSSIVVRRPSASILVVLPDGTRHVARVVAKDHHRDLVLLKIDTDQPLVAIELPSQLDVRIGQTTIAVGRYGSDASPMVSSGVLSATERLDGIALQTDARVSPALYGGPLVDLSGNVLGVLTPAVAAGGAEDATSWYDSGIAFAIPANVLKRKLDRLRSGKDIKKGLIGIVGKSKDPYENDTEIAAVRTRSPAENSGIKPGDQVVSVAAKPVRRFQEIRQVLGSYDAGEVIRITLRRDGKTRAVDVTLAESIPPLQPQRLGVIVREQKEDASDDASTIVIVDAVLPASAATKHLKSGDSLLRIGDSDLNDAESFRRLMISAEPDRAIEVVYQRDGVEGTAEITPQAIAGKISLATPDSWQQASEAEWPIVTVKLPDVANVSAIIAPADSTGLGQLGLLMLLLNPGQGAPEEVLKDWVEPARQAGVVVCAIAPENNGRWQPKELDVVTRFAAAAIKKSPIDLSAVAVAASGAIAGTKAEAADSMAVAVAISQSSTFFGVAVSSQTRPPAVRVRENQASASLQILLPIDSNDDLPPWSLALQKAGYPIVLGGATDHRLLLQWVRLLQAI